MNYDLVIIGGGPAGSAAAVYAARKQLKTALVTVDFGGQSIVSDDIQNWIGTPHISGNDLAKNLKNHIENYKSNWVEIKEGKKVINLEKNNNDFLVKLEDESILNTKAVLITAGSSRRKLDAIGAERLEHKGLTYCASCDGPLFSDMDVVVIGGGNAAFETALQLVAYCKSVTILNRSDRFRADETTVNKIKQNPKIRIITNIEIKEIIGENFVSGIKILNKETDIEEILNISGIFVEIGQISNGDFLKDIVAIDDFGKIKIDPWTQRTQTDGIWAAGDITNIKYHQNNIAAGDGVKAIEDLYTWIKDK